MSVKCPWCKNEWADAIGPSGSDYYQCRMCSRAFDLDDAPTRCSGTDIVGDPCRNFAVDHLNGFCVGCHELNELCRRHDEWYEEHGGEG